MSLIQPHGTLGKFGEDPDYSKLLETITKSPIERSQLLRSYFEANDDERRQGLKLPTEAHKAIAELVSSKYVRVIITTNFDRLLEKELISAGVIPLVISNPDTVQGAIPITHSACTIIKVNGDYLDTQIKNTSKELEHFDERIDHILDHIFDEFGLIVCGWSAEWDSALRSAIERCKCHRFTSYWAARGKITDIVKKLIDLRNDELVQIENADSFFCQLCEKVHALENLSQPDPFSIEMTTSTVKEHLIDEIYRNRLPLLVTAEIEKLFKELSGDNLSMNTSFSPEEIVSRVRRYEALTKTIQALMITGCYRGEESHQKLWVHCIERISTPPLSSGVILWHKLRLYPALLLLYAGGIAALAGEQYKTFAELITKPKISEQDESIPVIFTVNTKTVIYSDLVQHTSVFSSMSKEPISDHLFRVFREPLRKYLPDDTDYQKCFDRFEYLLALIHADLSDKFVESSRFWGPVGSFGDRLEVIADIVAEAIAAGNAWPPIQSGLFDGSIERFMEVKNGFNDILYYWRYI